MKKVCLSLSVLFLSVYLSCLAVSVLSNPPTLSLPPSDTVRARVSRPLSPSLSDLSGSGLARSGAERNWAAVLADVSHDVSSQSAIADLTWSLYLDT